MKQTFEHRAVEPDPGAEKSPDILIFAYDRQPLSSRRKLLEKNGYRVLLSSQFPSARSLIRNKSHALTCLVIGHAVPEHERQELSGAYRKTCPKGRVIFLYKDKIKNPRSDATALLSINGATDNLLMAIRTMQTSSRASSSRRSSSSRKNSLRSSRVLRKQ